MFSHKTDPDQRSDDDRAYTEEGANDETENTETENTETANTETANAEDVNAEDVNADGTEARAPFGEPVDGADDDVTDASAESAHRDVTDSDTIDGDVVDTAPDDDHHAGFTAGDNDAADANADAEADADLDADADAVDARDDVIDGVVVDEHSSTAPLDDEQDDEQMSAQDAAVVTADDHTGDDDPLAGERDGEFAGDQPSHVDMSRVDQEALLEDEDNDADVDDVDDFADVDEAGLTDDDADTTAASDLGTDATGYAGDAVPVVVVDEPADQDAGATPDDADLVTTGADASLPNGSNGVLRPGDAPIPGGDVAIADTDAIHERWQQVQLGFIDDPRGSTTGARDIAANALENHITALRARLTSLDVWQQETKPDTEVLRAAMQGYRAMVEALIGQAP